MKLAPRHACAASLALLLLPATARAQQLDYGLSSGLSWTDNVYSNAEDAGDSGLDKVSDYSMRVSPWAEASDPDGNLTWSLRYMPSYEYYLDEVDIRGFDHDVNGSMSATFAERWTLQLSNLFQRYNSVSRFNQNAADPTAPAVFRAQTDDILSNFARASLRYQLGPRDSLGFFATYLLRDYDDEAGGDRDTITSGLSYRRILTERTTAGARLSWSHQSIERLSGEDDVTDFYNLSAVFEHAFSRTFRLEGSAGPTLIDSDPPDEFQPNQFAFGRFQVPFGGQVPLAIDATSCRFDPVLGEFVTTPRFQGCGISSSMIITEDEFALLQNLTRQVPSVDGLGAPFSGSDLDTDEITYFAYLALVKDFETWSIDLSYQRSADESGNFGTSNVVDTVASSLRWKPRPLWTVNFSVAASQLEQASEQLVPTALVVRNADAPAGVTSVSQLAEVQSIVARADDDALDWQTLSTSLSVTRELTQRASASLALYYYRQRATREIDDAPQPVIPGKQRDDELIQRWNSLTLGLSLNWRFETLRF
jgi:hypothetical protein